MNDTDLLIPQLYINRELSFLEFNQRVLEQAKDSRVPLLERVRFLCISCANLDEFFEIRVAASRSCRKRARCRAGRTACPVGEQLKAIRTRASRLVEEQYEVLNEVLMPELAKNGVVFVSPEQWTEAQAKWLEDYFTPRGRAGAEPAGLGSCAALPKDAQQELEFRDRGRRRGRLRPQQRARRRAGAAFAAAPHPAARRARQSHFVFLGTIVEAFVSKLFAGMHMRGCYQFRVTRNSDLFVEQEEVDDLLRAVEGELASRRYGDAVRLETAHDCPEEILNICWTNSGSPATIYTRSQGR